MKIIPYDKNMDIRNTDILTRGAGAKYMECYEDRDGQYIACRWRRTIPKISIINHVLIQFGAQSNP